MGSFIERVKVDESGAGCQPYNLVAVGENRFNATVGRGFGIGGVG
jgi:hypothetical protein